MTQHDPIASPTLALLYVSQGHVPRARAILDELLHHDPEDGHALALAHRLGPPPGRIHAKLEGADLVVTWQGIIVRPPVFVVAVTARMIGTRVRTGVTSVRCRSPFGRVEFACPQGAGTVAACIGRVVPGGGFVASAIAAPLAWS